MNRIIKLLEKRLLFRDLMEASGPAIYCLINEKDKRVYVLSTTDLVKSVAAQASMLGRRTHPIKALKRDKKYIAFKLLEMIKETDALSLANALFIAKYRWIAHYDAHNEAYAHYNAHRTPTYRARISYTETYKAQVELVSNGRKIYPVREFATEAEAQAFIANNTIISLLIIAKSKKRP